MARPACDSKLGVIYALSAVGEQAFFFSVQCLLIMGFLAHEKEKWQANHVSYNSSFLYALG